MQFIRNWLREWAGGCVFLTRVVVQAGRIVGVVVAAILTGRAAVAGSRAASRLITVGPAIGKALRPIVRNVSSLTK